MLLNTELIEFVGDILVVVSKNSANWARRLANEALLKVVGMIRKIGLHMVAHKTEAILFTSKRKYGSPKSLMVYQLP